MPKDQSRREIYVRGTVKCLLAMASSQTEYPTRSISKNPEEMSPHLKVVKLGKMSTESAHILDQMFELGEHIQNTTKPPGDYANDIPLYGASTELCKLVIPVLRSAFWKGIKVEFYSEICRGDFPNLMILPNWQVAGVYLTNTDQLQHEDFAKIMKEHFT